MATFLSRFKEVTGNIIPPCDEPNPIMDFFILGKQVANAGPNRCWHIYDAVRRSDEQNFSVFIMEKRLTDRLFRAKKSEALLERVRQSIEDLDRWRHQRFLKVVHPLEEGPNTLAFASEWVLGSLANILEYQDSIPLEPNEPEPISPFPWSLEHSFPPSQSYEPSKRARFAVEYSFEELELRYGMQQMIDALRQLHYMRRRVHRNVCPENILVTKKAIWKLFGFDFCENLIDEPKGRPTVSIWTVKVSKMCQPNMNYLSPECHATGKCGIVSDMYALGLVMCAVINKGRQIIQAHNNPQLFIKQMRHVELQLRLVINRAPECLQQPLLRMITRAAPLKPIDQPFPEPVIEAMQTLENTTLRDPTLKDIFFRNTLIEVMPEITTKLRWTTVWPSLVHELFDGDTIRAAFKSAVVLIAESTEDEYDKHVRPVLIKYVKSTRSVQSVVGILENMPAIVEKSPEDIIKYYLVPYACDSLDQTHGPVLYAGLTCLGKIHTKYDNTQMIEIILPKTKKILETYMGDSEILNQVLELYEVFVKRMECKEIVEKILPTLLYMRLTEAKVVLRVVNLYKSLVDDKKMSLSINIMATKMIPTLAPHTVNPNLDIDQFIYLMEIIYDMLDAIDRVQRQNFHLEKCLSVTERFRVMRKLSTDLADPPPFEIPIMRPDHYRTKSAEEMARRMSSLSVRPGTATPGATSAGVLPRGSSGRILPRIETTGPRPMGLSGAAIRSTVNRWFYGSNAISTNATSVTTTTATTTAPIDNNLLRVGDNILPNRRLSDNTLITPKIRIAPSCASSPGGTPASSSANIPPRRHSSQQERRDSVVHLSPPTDHQSRGRGGSGSSLSVPVTSQRPGGSMPNTSTSSPYLMETPPQSVRSPLRSRRPSTATPGTSQGSGLLYQLSSGMVRHLPVGAQHTIRSAQPRISNWTTAGYNAISQQAAMAVRKCPSLNITLPK